MSADGGLRTAEESVLVEANLVMALACHDSMKSIRRTRPWSRGAAKRSVLVAVTASSAMFCFTAEVCKIGAVGFSVIKAFVPPLLPQLEPQRCAGLVEVTANTGCFSFAMGQCSAKGWGSAKCVVAVVPSAAAKGVRRAVRSNDCGEAEFGVACSERVSRTTPVADQTTPPYPLSGCHVELQSVGALRLIQALGNDKGSFGSALDSELCALQMDRERTQDQLQTQGSFSEPGLMEDEWATLDAFRRRVDEVETDKRARIVAELMYVRVVFEFRSRLEVDMLPRLAKPSPHKGFIRDLGKVDPRRLVGGNLYSASALGLVKEHVVSIMSEWEHLDGNFQLRLTTAQACQMYVVSALLGYYIRRVDLRYQLERAASSFEAIRSSLPEIVGAHASMEGASAGVSPTVAEQLAPGAGRYGQALKRYVDGFEQDELRQATSAASHEARLALVLQVSSLFGKASLHGSTELPGHDEVVMTQLTVSGVKRMLLEAVAFGTLLGFAEEEVDSKYGLSSEDPECFLSEFLQVAGGDSSGCLRKSTL